MQVCHLPAAKTDASVLRLQVISDLEAQVAQLKGQLATAQAKHRDDESKGSKLRQELQKAKGKIATLTGAQHWHRPHVCVMTAADALCPALDAVQSVWHADAYPGRLQVPDARCLIGRPQQEPA
jgi:hypothetical protein